MDELLAKKERFNKLVRYLIWTYDVPFQRAIKTVAEKSGVGHSNLSSALCGRKAYLTNSLISKVNYAYGEPFRKEWLINGTGEMLADNTPIFSEDPSKIIASQQETIKTLSDSLTALTALLKH